MRRERAASADWFLQRHGRAELEAFVRAAIDLLDSIDGDPDLEPEIERCEAGDDGCGLFLNGVGFAHWGSVWEEPAELTLNPEYAVDQTKRLGAPPGPN